MTADQIRNADGRNEAGWLREIAFQLAKLNEKLEEGIPFMADQIRQSSVSQ